MGTNTHQKDIQGLESQSPMAVDAGLVDEAAQVPVLDMDTEIPELGVSLGALEAGEEEPPSQTIHKYSRRL